MRVGVNLSAVLQGQMATCPSHVSGTAAACRRSHASCSAWCLQQEEGRKDARRRDRQHGLRTMWQNMWRNNNEGDPSGFMVSHLLSGLPVHGVLSTLSVDVQHGRLWRSAAESVMSRARFASLKRRLRLLESGWDLAHFCGLGRPHLRLMLQAQDQRAAVARELTNTRPLTGQYGAAAGPGSTSSMMDYVSTCCLQQIFGALHALRVPGACTTAEAERITNKALSHAAAAALLLAL